MLQFFNNEKTNQVKILSPQDVFKYIRPVFNFNKEYIYGIYLNTRNLLVHEELLSIGSLEGSSVQVRDIFYPAILHNAFSIIIVHNHPSGDPSPSENDIIFTQEVEKAAYTLQICFLDHVVITKNSYFSFKEHYKA